MAFSGFTLVRLEKRIKEKMGIFSVPSFGDHVLFVFGNTIKPKILNGH
jgi:hypothetical protein